MTYYTTQRQLSAGTSTYVWALNFSFNFGVTYANKFESHEVCDHCHLFVSWSERLHRKTRAKFVGIWWKGKWKRKKLFNSGVEKNSKTGLDRRFVSQMSMQKNDVLFCTFDFFVLYYKHKIENIQEKACGKYYML